MTMLQDLPDQDRLIVEFRQNCVLKKFDYSFSFFANAFTNASAIA